MGTALHPREAQRQKAVSKIVRAHSLVIDEWPDERVKRLCDEVRTEPLYRPIEPGELEREFLAEVKEKRSEVEVEPVRTCLTQHSEPVTVGWEAAGDD